MAFVVLYNPLSGGTDTLALWTDSAPVLIGPSALDYAIASPPSDTVDASYGDSHTDNTPTVTIV